MIQSSRKMLRPGLFFVDFVKKISIKRKGSCVNEESINPCDSDTKESRDRIGAGFGVAIVTAQHGKRVCLASWQRPIAGRAYIGMLRAFLWDREFPKGCSLTGLYCLVQVGKTHTGS